MKRLITILTVVIFISGGTLLFAQTNNTVFKSVSGTVEVKAPDSSLWLPAQAGMAIEQNTAISTGFKSSALLAVGNSVITIKPLTRLTVEEIITLGENEKVNLYLQNGRVRADVTPPAGGKTDFAVRSPTATAAVRGTVFEFDTVNLNVIEGRVLFFSSTGSRAVVRGREQSMLNESGLTITAPQETAAATFTPELPPGTDAGGSVNPGSLGVGTPGQPGTYADISIGAGW
ncbi:iron dicitrate transporter FecR [Spirochaetia bacterium]|nr:iron dicitrate transporter FecR [Spirochaetia bacterium]